MPVTPVVVEFNDASSTDITLALGGVDVATGFTVVACIKRASTGSSFDTLMSVGSSPPPAASRCSPQGSHVSRAAQTTRSAGQPPPSPTSSTTSGTSWCSGRRAGRPTRPCRNTGSEHHLGARGARNQPAGHGPHRRHNQARPVPIGSDRFEGFGAVWAVLGDNLSNANRETLADDLDAWLALSPQAMWVANGSTAIVDEVGAADETGRGAGVTAAVGQTSPLEWAGGTTHFGSVTLPLAATITTAGTAKKLGVTATPLTISMSVAGTAKKTGSVTLPLALTISTGASQTVGASATLPLSITFDTTAFKTARSSVTLPLTITFTTSLAVTTYGAGYPGYIAGGLESTGYIATPTAGSVT